MPHGPELPRDDLLQPVSPLRRRGQPQPASRRDLPHHPLDRRRRHVVALVHDHQPVPGRHLDHIVPPCQRLHRRNVDHTPALLAAATELPRLDTQQVRDLPAPLLGQGGPVHQHEGRHPDAGRIGAGDDRLAGPRRRHEHPEVVADQVSQRLGLIVAQRGGEVEILAGAVHALVREVQPRPLFGNESLDQRQQSAGQHQVAVDGHVVTDDEPRHVPRGPAQALPLVELWVADGRRVPQGRRHCRGQIGGGACCALRGGETLLRWGEIGGSDGHLRADADPDRSGCGVLDPRGAGGTQVRHRLPHGRRLQVPRHACHGPRRHAVHRRQQRPLIRVRLHRRQVEEHCGALSPAAALQRCGDEVAEAGGGEHVLGREEPVVAGQAHPPPDAHRLPQQAEPQLPRGAGRHRLGEEHPRVRTLAGPRNLQHCRHPCGTGSLEVGQRVQHREGPVEVRGEPPARVAGGDRVQAQVEGAGEVVGHDLRCDREQVGAAGVHAAAPPTAGGGHPAGRAFALVLPPHGVDVGPRDEQLREEGDFGRWRGGRCEQARMRRCHRRLCGRWRSRFRAGEPEQGCQPRHLRPQRGDFVLHRAHPRK